MLHTLTLPCLDLTQIAHSGQCFRMCPLPMPVCPSDILPFFADQGYHIISRGRILLAFQKGETFFLLCPEEELAGWLAYLDADRDYPGIIASIDPADTYLSAAAKAGAGIRILKQEPWEMIITFLISQQKTIPAIQSLVEALCRTYGHPIELSEETRTILSALSSGNSGVDFPPSPAQCAFPTPEELSRASLEDLQAMKLGYRAKYIHRICQDVLSGSLDLNALAHMEYAQAMDYLTGFYGIGKKVANCVCLFGLHHIGAFPVDTWIEKILMEHYYDKKKYRRTPKAHLLDRMVRDYFGQYGGSAGIMQQYIFYYERLLQNKIRFT